MPGSSDKGGTHEEPERFRVLAEAAFEGLAIHDQGTIVETNRALADMFGYDADEVIGMNVLDLAAPESRATIAEHFRSGSASAYEGVGLRKDGTRFVGELRGRPITYRGRPMRATAIRDVTDRRKMHEILGRITDAFFALDPEWRFAFVNSAAASMLRREPKDLIGRCIWEDYPDLVGTVSEIELRRAMKQQGPVEYESLSPVLHRLLRVRAFPSLEGVTVYFRDVTEQRRLEAQLREAQKLEAIGRLAGGVAHDFNNLLTVMLARSTIMRRSVQPGSLLEEGIDELQRAAERAADITRQLLAFGRQQVLQPRALDLNALIGSRESMLRRLLREDIELRTFLTASLGTVSADPVQVEQVLMNLVVNARDAMPEGGVLTLETANVTLDDAYASTHAGVTPGDYALLSVSDTGVGMSKETLERIFEPFFTTKETGHGTGLGLATVFGIVKQSEGHIWVYSEPGRGTTFKMYLPRIAAAPSTDAVPPAPGVVLRGAETILLVEDDPQVRHVVRSLLEDSGYRVLATSGPREALEVEQTHRGPIQLLLTDVVMPEMSGRRLAETIAKSRPEIRVLYMSGYTQNVIVHGVLDAGVAFLQKPMTADALSRKVREVLDQPVAPAT